MCRRNLLLGIALAGFGLGLLLSCCFESALFCGCIGLMILAGGIFVVKCR